MIHSSNHLIQFVRSRYFLVHLSLCCISVAVLLVVTYLWLNAYTNHGESVTVPDVRGMKFEKLEEFLRVRNLKVSISDSSVFSLDHPAGVVIDQNPPPEEHVKEGRIIYVSVTRKVPPQVKLPNLLSVSQRQAEAILRSYGLKVGEMEFRPDLAKDAVLAVLYKNAEKKPGDEIPKGSFVDLVIGDGIGNTEVPVPVLVGLTLEEALFVLQGSQLQPGAVIYDATVKDSATAIVYRQVPVSGDSAIIKQGESVDIFLSGSMDKFK